MANKVRNNPNAPSTAPVRDLDTLNKLQAMYEKNKKRINTISTVIIVVVVAALAYFKLYKAPREEKASSKMAYAQMYFQIDSMKKALNGDGKHEGFLQIIKKYSGTDAENLSHYYAGVCYMKTGDFNNAIKQLKDFNGKGTIATYAAYGLLGDAYMETNKTKEGIEYYTKASENKDDQVWAPIYLYRLAKAYEMNKQPDDAKKAYKRIRDEYPKSNEAREIGKDLARLGELE